MRGGRNSGEVAGKQYKIKQKTFPTQTQRIVDLWERCIYCGKKNKDHCVAKDLSAEKKSVNM